MGKRLTKIYTRTGDDGTTGLADGSRTAKDAPRIAAIGEVDVLLLPVGGGPTVGGESAAAIVRVLRPRLVVPMHYRTEAVNFLEPPDAFLEALGARVERLAESELVAEELLGKAGDPTVALLAPPLS